MGSIPNCLLKVIANPVLNKYPVSREYRDEFSKYGHTLLRGVAAAEEVAVHRGAIANAVRRLAVKIPDLDERDTYGKAFLQVTNLWEKNDAVKRFVFEKKFAQIAADLLGVEKVRLYHDQALFKEPGGGRTPWHQDQYYWPLDTDKMITMWMPLVDIDDEMGMVTFASGSHAYGAIDNVEISDKSEELLAAHISERGFPFAKAESMNAGDATFHLGWTIHSAGPNGSDRMREAMTIIYYADGARITEPRSVHQQADLDTWFPGQQPGELASSPLNPILN
jgi:ectoine hydroxylase-related dioxygenase (phytanoyl-CoA dioxygenase family)